MIAMVVSEQVVGLGAFALLMLMIGKRGTHFACTGDRESGRAVAWGILMAVLALAIASSEGWI